MRMILVGALLGLTTAVSWAAIADDGFNLKDSVVVSLSRKGQAAVQAQIVQMLSNKDLNLLERDLPDFQYREDKPIELAKLPPGYERFGKTVREVRKTIRKWLVGFRLNDPQPLVEAEGIRYQVGLEDFDIDVDYDMENACLENTVFMRLKAKIPNFKFKISRLRAKDVNNSILGVFGANFVWLGLDPASGPLTLEIPVKISVKESGTFKIEVLKVITNLAQVRLASGFEAPLVMPKLQVRIGDQVSTLSHDKVRKLIESKQPQMMEALVRYFDEFAQKKLPGQLNLVLNQAVKKGFEFSGAMKAPGEPKGARNAKLKYSMRPQDVNMRDGLVDLSFVGKLEDPEASRAYYGFNPAERRPYLSHDPGQYDFALAISLKYVNRLVQMGFDRGNFENMLNSDGTYLHFAESPRFVADDGRLKFMDLQLRLIRTPSVTESLVLLDPFQVAVEGKTRVLIEDGVVQLNMEVLNENFISIEDRYIRKNGFFDQTTREIVHHEALKVLKKENLKFHVKKGLTLADKLPIPSQLMGMALEVQDVQIDPAGFIVTYINFMRP
ncbi:hypothetical protein WDW86_02370 [Bdellovibrionota bacterium FG-2]